MTLGDFKTFARNLKENKKVESLCFTAAYIDDDMGAVLAQAVGRAKTLTKFALRRCSGKGIAKVFQALDHVAMVDVMTSEIGEEGAKALQGLILKSKNLTALKLGPNVVSEEIAAVLASSSVTSLSICCNGRSIEEVRIVARIVRGTNILHLLEVSSRSLPDETAQILVEALMVNTSVCCFEVKAEQVSDTGFAFAELIRSNRLRCLAVIGLTGSEPLDAMAEALRSNRSLTSIEIASKGGIEVGLSKRLIRAVVRNGMLLSAVFPCHGMYAEVQISLERNKEMHHRARRAALMLRKVS